MKGNITRLKQPMRRMVGEDDDMIVVTLFPEGLIEVRARYARGHRSKTINLRNHAPGQTKMKL